MELTIDGQAVRLRYLFFQKKNGGHILEILVAKVPDEARSIHKNLKEQLERIFPSVMEKDKTADGYTEIRILGGSMLQFIDAVRAFGRHITETNPIYEGR